jgi:hypothetical protein
MQAAKANHLTVARLLLRHGANPFIHVLSFDPSYYIILLTKEP